MTRGLLKKYTIGNRDYSITQLLDYDGVREVVSHRKTEGSKRELLRDLLKKGAITPSMITGRGATVPSTYGAQSRRAGKPLRTTASVSIEGRARFHDTVYEGPYEPTDRRYGAMKKGALRNSKGEVIEGPRRGRNPRPRGTMHFLGVRRSAKEASNYFPRLKKMVDGGKCLKQSTIEAKIRKAYKRGIDESLLTRHEARFDRERKIRGKGAGVVKHYYFDNPDRTLGMESYLQEVASESIRLMDEHQGYKMLFKLKIHLDNIKDEDGPDSRSVGGLRTTQIEIRPVGENDEVYYKRVIRELEESFENLKLNESGLVISFIEHAELTFSKVNNTGTAGHFVSLPKWLRSKKAIINIQNKDEFCFKWAVTRALHMESANNVRVTPYLRKRTEELDWSGVTFPVVIGGDDVCTFERNNKIGVAIYAHSSDEEGGEPVVYRFRSPTERFGKVVNLFMLKLPLGSGFDYHFCTIHRLSALLRMCEGREKRVVNCSFVLLVFTTIRILWDQSTRVGKRGRPLRLRWSFVMSMRRIVKWLRGTTTFLKR